jgi:hypothetical protein
MSFLVAFEGAVANTATKKPDGTPANVANWPANGASFKGSFVYTPSATPSPVLFSKIFTDFGSFTITRPPGIGHISLPNGGAGIQYADSDSLGFNNVSLPAAGWQLQEFDVGFTNPQNYPAVNPAALDFNLFAERGIYTAGTNGATTNTIVWSILARIDVVIVLPA